MTTRIVSGRRPARFPFARGSAQCEPVLVRFRKQVTTPIIRSYIRVAVDELGGEIAGQGVGGSFANCGRKTSDVLGQQDRRAPGAPRRRLEQRIAFTQEQLRFVDPQEIWSRILRD